MIPWRKLYMFDHLKIYFRNRKFEGRYVKTGRNKAKFGPAASISSDSPELIRIGSDVLIDGILQSYYGKGKIEIGDLSYVGPNTRIWSFVHVRIGSHVLISHNCNIFDSNCHPVNAEERRKDYLDLITTGRGNKRNTVVSQEVVIGDDCWIGANSCIMKGVSLGERTIVAAGSVVTKSFPSDVVVGGNPARILRYIDQQENG